MMFDLFMNVLGGCGIVGIVSATLYGVVIVWIEIKRAVKDDE